MATYRLNDDTRNFARCSTCDATMTAEAAAEPHSSTDANTVCSTCGVSTVVWPSDGCSYFEVVMKLGRSPPPASSRLRK